ncbi:MAG: dihydroorotate dehydrogenase electron transfer subunit [Dehalobacter sp. 4CP]|uniref:dihydroorotate dehydrogenase electron transfer subunit n=1 Tax=Dehalobacter sp. CP TaxID=2594474 RepID=UPI0013C8D1D9|nr:dihydroorotate dehydrogenase electron transfer subunit [Dehalobacter sp. 4CP]
MNLKEKVVFNERIGHPVQGLYKLVLSGEAAKTAQPGQFLHIQVTDTSDPLLRRPLSIAGIDPERGEVTVYYRIKGKGTELLSRIPADQYLSVLGPLGTGFSIPEKGELLLIAGGIGMFPLFSVIQAAQKVPVKIKVLWGGENKEFLVSADPNQLLAKGLDVELATLDGSCGEKGLVTALLEKHLADKNTQQLLSKGLLQAAACGPNGMLKAVAGICQNNDVPLEVSLEERMACGVGACLGCVCTVRDANGGLKRKRVCKEGPVMNGQEVVWDADI